jgi:hypothetical protein
MTSGSTDLPGGESQRGQKHVGKAGCARRRVRHLARKTRVIWRRLMSLKLGPSDERASPDHHVYAGPAGKDAENVGIRMLTNYCVVGAYLPTAGRRARSPLKGHNEPPTSRSIRPIASHHGIAYGARALRRRSPHSSRSRGKPGTGRRGTGDSMTRQGGS